ncbi:MAG: hypothetical protein VW634_08405, partial [Paracoccaceae bacterium]
FWSWFCPCSKTINAETPIIFLTSNTPQFLSLNQGCHQFSAAQNEFLHIHTLQVSCPQDFKTYPQKRSELLN